MKAAHVSNEDILTRVGELEQAGAITSSEILGLKEDVAGVREQIRSVSHNLERQIGTVGVQVKELVDRQRPQLTVFLTIVLTSITAIGAILYGLAGPYLDDLREVKVEVRRHVLQDGHPVVSAQVLSLETHLDYLRAEILRREADLNNQIQRELHEQDTVIEKGNEALYWKSRAEHAEEHFRKGQ